MESYPQFPRLASDCHPSREPHDTRSWLREHSRTSRPLGTALLMLTLLMMAPRAEAQFLQQGVKLVGTGAASAAQQGQSVAVSADGNTAASGGSNDGAGAGAAWVWTRSGAVWSQQGAKLVGTGAVGAANQGISVAVSADGNTIVVGGYGDNAGAGAAWVWTRSGGVWSQQGTKLVGTGAVGAAHQGFSVAVSADGNTAIVGAYGDNGNAGAAWVWTRSGGVWSQQGSKLVGTGAVGTTLQGYSVAVSADGNTAIVGGYGDNANAGAAWVWTRSGGVWTQQGSKLVGTGAVGAAFQGFSVALSGDGNTAVVGGDADNGSAGAAWVWTRNGGVWSQQGGKLVGTGAAGTAGQGVSVAVSGDGNTAVVGGDADNANAGAAWVWARSGGVWSQQGGKLAGTGSVGPAYQGYSIAVSGAGNTVVVGGIGDNSFAGATWVFINPSPKIASIQDVPNDQGGKLHVLWNASVVDVAPSYGISSYTLWRRITTATAAQAAAHGATFFKAGDASDRSPLYDPEHRPIRVTTEGTQSLFWEFVESIPARGVSGYGYMAPTTSDSLPSTISSQQGTKLVGTGAVGNTVQGCSVAVSADGNTAIVGGYGDNGSAGAAWVWTRNGGAWSQQGPKLVGSGGVGLSQQGYSVALSADGNTALVGGYGDNGSAGAAWVWTRNGGAWSQQGTKLVGTGVVGFALQGASVALSADGNTAVIGGYSDNSSTGAAWVWTRSGGVWTQQAKLVGTGSVGTSYQGQSVALSADGNTVMVGGHGDNGAAGAAWVWTRSGSVWTQQGAKLVGTGVAGLARQGWSVALSADGNTAIVGGVLDNGNAGATWVWTRSGGVWSQQGAKLVGTGAVGAASQGSSVAVSGDGNIAVVGGSGDNGFAGAVWVWMRSGGVWSQQGAKLVGTGAVGTADQGNSVAVSADGHTALEGGFADNGNVGAAWVFSPTIPWNVFFVDAKDATSSAFYVSAPDSGYSVDNLPPGPPAPVTAAFSAGATYLHWGVNLEADFSMYRVYRGNSAGFVPGAGNLVTTKPDTGYADVGPPGSYYKISAVDNHGNESGFALVTPALTAGVSGDEPLAFALEGVRPNPASGRDLTVHFVLPVRAAARLELFDVAGRSVVGRDVGALGPGAHAVNLAERARMRPGLYFVRLKQGANEKVARVTVLE